MRKISKLFILYFLVISAAFVSCEAEEEQYGWRPGDGLIINGPTAVSTLTEETFYVEGFTVNENYTWTVDGQPVTPMNDGEDISFFFDEPGDYTITVDNGSLSGELIVTASSVPQEVLFGGDTVLSAVEGDVLEIPVVISERNPDDITTVSFSVSGGVEGEDYEILTPSPLVFLEMDEDGEPVGSSADTIRVRLLKNNLLQEARELEVTLNSVVTTGEGEYEVSLAEYTQEVVVTVEDQIKYVYVVDASDTLVLTSVNDAGVYSFPVELNMAADETVIVNYEVSHDGPVIGIPATGVQDLTRGSLTFRPGVISQSVTLDIGEGALESNRYIWITITSIDSDDEQVMVETIEDEEVSAVKVISVETE